MEWSFVFFSLSLSIFSSLWYFSFIHRTFKIGRRNENEVQENWSSNCRHILWQSRKKKSAHKKHSRRKMLNDGTVAIEQSVKHTHISRCGNFWCKIVCARAREKHGIRDADNLRCKTCVFDSEKGKIYVLRKYHEWCEWENDAHIDCTHFVWRLQLCNRRRKTKRVNKFRYIRFCKTYKICSLFSARFSCFILPPSALLHLVDLQFHFKYIRT